MSIMSQEAKKQLGCVLHWSGESAVSGTYDDDGNKRGFLILPDGVTVTPNGTFAVEKMKDGRNIWKFNGTDAYITVSDHDAWHLGNGDFTICFWVNLSDISNRRCILSQSVDAANVWWIYFHPDNYIGMACRSGGVDIIDLGGSGFGIVASTWYHFTIVRSGTTIKSYLNDVLKTTITDADAFPNFSASLQIGKTTTVNVTTYTYLPGNVKDLQIHKGKALTQDQIAAIMAETYIY